MKITSAAALMALALWLTGVSAGYAQSPTQPTPTTRILAIGTINQGAGPRCCAGDPDDRSAGDREALFGW